MTITISHSHSEGTLLTGTARGDGSAEAIKSVKNRLTARTLWRWSGNLGAWYIQRSRDKGADHQSIEATKQALQAAGFAVEVDIDDTRRSAAEVEEARNERQIQLVDRLDARADRKHAAADAAAARERAASAALPEGGEPIKIGHHSEQRHRKAIERAHTALSKSVAADRAARQADERAATAATTTERRYAPPVIRRRIERLTADLRKQERARDGHTRTLYTDGRGVKHVETTAPATGAHRDRVLGEIDRLNDEIGYWKGQLDVAVAAGAALWDKTTIVVGDMIVATRTPYRVLKVNTKTVRVEGRFGGGLLPYSDITKVFNHEGKPVTITDGARSIE